MGRFTKYYQIEHFLSTNFSDFFLIIRFFFITGDTNVAKPAVEKIFEELSLLFPGYDELKDFVNAKESNGQTALDFALAKGHDDIVEILLQNNADVSIK